MREASGQVDQRGLNLKCLAQVTPRAILKYIEVGVRQVIESSVAPSPCGDFLDHLGTLQRLWGTQNTLGAPLLMPVNALIWVIALTKTRERGVRAHAREIRCGFFGARARVNVTRH